MILKPDTVRKILEIGSGESVNKGFLSLFEAVANDTEQQNLPSGTLIVPFYDQNSGLEPGDFVAELHFVVRRVEKINDDFEEEVRHADNQPSSTDEAGDQGSLPQTEGGHEAGGQ